MLEGFSFQEEQRWLNAFVNAYQGSAEHLGISNLKIFILSVALAEV